MARTYPIVLAHGIARFDALTDVVLDIDNDDAFDHKHYFKNVRTHLRAQAFDVWHTKVDWAGSVDQRSADLKSAIDGVFAQTGAAKLHIVAHSMGGLDTRHMLLDHRHDGLHQKIASVTTIATPHGGSPAADLAVNPFGFFGGGAPETMGAPSFDTDLEELRDSPSFDDDAEAFARCFGLELHELSGGPSSSVEVLGGGSLLSGLAGIRDLTTDAAAAFNDASLDWERSAGVHFQSYAGAEPLDDIFPPLRLPWRIISRKEGDNDGLVSVSSAKWADDFFVRTLPADHLNELGWWPDVRNDAERAQKEAGYLAFYLDLAETLAARFPVT